MNTSSLMLLQLYEEHGEAFLSRIFTRDETWVVHSSPESKPESITWKHPHSPVRKKLKIVQSPGKVTATVFWEVHGVLLVDFTPPGSTNADAYQETLKRLKEVIRRKRPGLLTKGLGVLLLHDNSRPHSAAATVNLWNSWGWEILPHPPYSPDFAPSAFHLFPKTKKHLRGQRFHSTEDVQNEAKKWLRAQDDIFSMKDLTN
jgi:histone-lysine N-methyltransferase SETMAR